MSRLRLIMLSMLAVSAVLAISAIGATAASAQCLKVVTAGTGTFEKSTCEGAVGTKEFIKVEELKEIKNGEACGKVIEKETGTFATLATCEAGTPKVAKGEFIRVMIETEAEQQFFQNGKKEPPSKLGLKSTEKVSTLTVPNATVTCKSDTDAGKLVGRESVEKLVVTFKECEEPSKKCPVRSTTAKAGVENEIVTNNLKGELGEVAAGEATSEVGLLLEGETTNVFVTLESKTAGCLPVSPSAVEGSVVGEVTPLTLGLKDKVEFGLNTGGAQKVKTFERSFAKHCGTAPVARKCEVDFPFKPKLSVFGSSAATFTSSDENTFEEELEVNKGS